MRISELMIREVSGTGEPLGDAAYVRLVSSHCVANDERHSVLLDRLLGEKVGLIVRVAIDRCQERPVTELCSSDVGDRGV